MYVIYHWLVKFPRKTWMHVTTTWEGSGENETGRRKFGGGQYWLKTTNTDRNMAACLAILRAPWGQEPLATPETTNHREPDEAFHKAFTWTAQTRSPRLWHWSPDRAHLPHKCHEGCDKAADRVLSEPRPASVRGWAGVKEARRSGGTQRGWGERVPANQQWQRQPGTPSPHGFTLLGW